MAAHVASPKVWPMPDLGPTRFKTAVADKRSKGDLCGYRCTMDCECEWPEAEDQDVNEDVVEHVGCAQNEDVKEDDVQQAVHIRLKVQRPTSKKPLHSRWQEECELLMVERRGDYVCPWGPLRDRC